MLLAEAREALRRAERQRQDAIHEAESLRAALATANDAATVQKVIWEKYANDRIAKERSDIAAEIAHHRAFLSRVLHKLAEADPEMAILGSADDAALFVLVTPDLISLSRHGRRNFHHLRSFMSLKHEIARQGRADPEEKHFTETMETQLTGLARKYAMEAKRS